MSLEVMTLQPVCDKVETIQGVPICVTGVAQVKIMKKHELLSVAAEQFLGKELREVHYTGKSLSEVFILASTNPQYNIRLFIYLPVYKLRTCSVHKLF